MPTIKGVVETSFLDWPGKVCAAVFLPGCNFRCPFCHNHPLILEPESLPSTSIDAVLLRLSRFKTWLFGLCISGGEPTLHPDLEDLLRQCKAQGWPIKLDTNGTRPWVLERLLADNLIDMVAMDVKAPLEQEAYSRCAGVAVDLDQIRASIRLIKQSGLEHEFRMTILPGFHTRTAIIAWTHHLTEIKGVRPSRLRLQNFKPQSTLDPNLIDAVPFTPEKFARLQQMVAQTVATESQSTAVPHE